LIMSASFAVVGVKDIADRRSTPYDPLEWRRAEKRQRIPP
jgi:hypothetical protein